MKWLLSTAVFVSILIATPLWASSITWGPATLSDDNGGNFLAGSTFTSTGSTAFFALPSFSTSGTFGFPSNQVNIDVSASIGGGTITGVTVTLFGSFTGAGFAQFSQTADAAPAFAGSFSGSSITGFIAVNPSTSLNLSTQLNLFDQGDDAAITGVKLSLTTVPEPSTITLLGSALAALAGLQYYRRKRQFLV